MLSTRLRRWPVLTSRANSAILVDATSNRSTVENARMPGMSETLQCLHPGVLQAIIPELCRKRRSRSGRAIMSLDLAGRILCIELECRHVVHYDDLAFHATDVGDL